MDPSQLRDNDAQRKYRKQSQSQKKQKKHVAHYLSLETAAFFNSFLLNPVPTQQLKKLCNDPCNFRMVKIHENLSTHKKIDNYMMKMWNTVIMPQINAK
eukprot:405313_1